MRAWPVMPGWQGWQDCQDCQDCQIFQEYEILPHPVGERGLWDGARVTR